MTGTLPHFHEIEPPADWVETDAIAEGLDDHLFPSAPLDHLERVDGPVTDGEASEERAASDDPDVELHVGFDAPMSAAASKPRSRKWLTIAAWAGSIAAHAVIATAAVFLAEQLTLKRAHTPPGVHFALGDTSEDHGVRNHEGADALPGVTGAMGSAIAPDAGAAAAEAEPQQPAVATLPPPPPNVLEPEPVTENGVLPIVPPATPQAKLSDLPFHPSKLELPADPMPSTADASKDKSSAAGDGAATPASASMNGSGQAGGHSPVASMAGQNGATTGDGGTAISGVPGVRAGLRNGRKLVTPTYPSACRKAEEEGVVKLQVDVRADGTVANVTILDDAGHPRLAQAAVRSLDGFIFDPAMDENGHPVADSLRIPYTFQLKNPRK